VYTRLEVKQYLVKANTGGDEAFFAKMLDLPLFAMAGAPQISRCWV